MSINTNRGFSNKTALFILTIGYPLGIVLSAITYISSEKDTFWSTAPTEKTQEDNSINWKIAKSLLNSWWSSRTSVFGPPYDPSKVKNYIANGPYWKDINSPNGPVAWLRKKNQYYVYEKTEIVKVKSFDTKLENPKMIAIIDSSTVLKGKGINNKKASKITIAYTFAYEDGRWKIWDMQPVKK